jgi:hypothetical protein
MYGPPIASNLNENDMYIQFFFSHVTFHLSRHFQQYFSYIMATMITRREQPTLGKQMVNFITCGCESSAPFFCNLQSQARTHAVLVIGLYKLLGNPTT